jgi:hypothetical protein
VLACVGSNKEQLLGSGSMTTTMLVYKPQ